MELVFTEKAQRFALRGQRLETKGEHWREDVTSWVSVTTMCYASVRMAGREEKEKKKKEGGE